MRSSHQWQNLSDQHAPVFIVSDLPWHIRIGTNTYLQKKQFVHLLKQSTLTGCNNQPACLHWWKEAPVFDNLEGADTLWYPANNFSPGDDFEVYFKKVETIHWLCFLLCILMMPIADIPLSCDCSNCSQGFYNTLMSIIHMLTGCHCFTPARLDMFYQVPSWWAVRAIKETIQR